MRNTMTEPAGTTASVFAGHKLLLLSLPVIGAFLAFWLGMRFAPLRRGHEWEDTINRLTAAAVSSFLLGIAALVYVMRAWPSVFDAARALAVTVRLPPEAGALAVFGAVFLVCAIPGPWIFAVVYLTLKRTDGKDAVEIVEDLKKKR